MIKELIIIKLGGSVVTDKGKNKPTPRTKVIKSLAMQLKSLYHSQKYHLILVHGAGSFGHPIAKRYQLHKGMSTDDQKLGFSKVQQLMYKLNLIIMDQLFKQKLPAISLPPHAFVIQSAGKFKGFDLDIIRSLLDQNLIPVLFGDGVLDNQQGCSILSGDTIVSYLGHKLNAKKIVFLSDVDGIFDSDPKINPKAKCIPKITNRNLNKVLGHITLNNTRDVTGQMKGKILSIKSGLTKRAVFIVSGLKPDRLTKVIAQDQVGTKLLFH